MPNLNAVLKAEIQRLARKELKAQTAGTRKASAQHRRDIAELKRQIRDLKKDVAQLRRQTGDATGGPDGKVTAESIRFSPAWVKGHREKLELSAADDGAWVGVAALTVYNWESGKTRPQQAHLAAWAAVRRMGKREAWQRLETMDG